MVNVDGCVRRPLDVILAKRSRLLRTCAYYATAHRLFPYQTSLRCLTTGLFRRCEKRHTQLHVSTKSRKFLSLLHILTSPAPPCRRLFHRPFPKPADATFGISRSRRLGLTSCATTSQDAYAYQHVICLCDILTSVPLLLLLFSILGDSNAGATEPLRTQSKTITFSVLEDDASAALEALVST